MRNSHLCAFSEKSCHVSSSISSRRQHHYIRLHCLNRSYVRNTRCLSGSQVEAFSDAFQSNHARNLGLITHYFNAPHQPRVLTSTLAYTMHAHTQHRAGCGWATATQATRTLTGTLCESSHAPSFCATALFSQLLAATRLRAWRHTDGASTACSASTATRTASQVARSPA
jgi:hypothetical protein